MEQQPHVAGSCRDSLCWQVALQGRPARPSGAAGPSAWEAGDTLGTTSASLRTMAMTPPAAHRPERQVRNQHMLVKAVSVLPALRRADSLVFALLCSVRCSLLWLNAILPEAKHKGPFDFCGNSVQMLPGSPETFTQCPQAESRYPSSYSC